jgi:sterol desaturase/sphingolipid hydroxylase (fatty acid hydroxylase superfamily)
LLILDKFGFYWIAFVGIIVVRYFLIAGGIYWLFYSLISSPRRVRTLRSRPVARKAIQQDIELSIVSAIIFAFCSAFIVSAYDSDMTRIYPAIGQYGGGYLVGSFIAVLLLQDAYFYFVHRAFHHPALFKWFHWGHHRTGEPTPWTSFAFDPLEALVQALFLVGIVFILPLHFVTLIAVLLTMTLWTVWNHLGFELLPVSFPHHWLGKWLIGPTHHAIHHRKYRVHYGLYFTFWDRLLNTHDPNYEKEFGCSANKNQ